MEIPPISHEDRCIGCLLGTACGDILGAAVEGLPASAICQEFGDLRDLVDTDRGFGCYTDDIQKTLALVESLAARGWVDPEHVSAKYAEFYEPWRGYGGAAHRVMRALRGGADYRGTGRLQFPKGSFGNGGAMRIAPVGLAYRHAPDDLLRQAFEDALVCTHVHPEAIDGALVPAKAVAVAATSDATQFQPEKFLQAVYRASSTTIVQAELESLVR